MVGIFDRISNMMRPASQEQAPAERAESIVALTEQQVGEIIGFIYQKFKFPQGSVTAEPVRIPDRLNEYLHVYLSPEVVQHTREVAEELSKKQWPGFTLFSSTTVKDLAGYTNVNDLLFRVDL
jgi:hypothetical protein